MTRITRKNKTGNRTQRGAIFVEAIIIIASFTLFFMALVYFRVLYLSSAISSRLARGATIAYSMGGCEKVTPKDWVGTDAKTFTVNPPNSSSDTVDSKENMSPQGSNEASTATNNMPGMSGGKGILNPIGSVSVAGDVATSTGASLGRRKTVFKKHLEPKSYVTCGDVVRDGSFDEVFDYVKDAFGSKM